MEADRDSRLEALKKKQNQDPEADSNVADQEAATAVQTEIEDFEWKETDKATTYFRRNIPDDEQTIDDELRDIENKYRYITVMAKKFKDNDYWKYQITTLKKFRVMKYP